MDGSQPVLVRCCNSCLTLLVLTINSAVLEGGIISGLLWKVVNIESIMVKKE